MPATRVDGQTNHIATNIIARKAPISAPTTRFPAITTLTTNASSAMESASGAIAAAISKRAHGEWPCMHIPAARWPHASVRLAIWRENSLARELAGEVPAIMQALMRKRRRSRRLKS